MTQSNLNLAQTLTANREPRVIDRSQIPKAYFEKSDRYGFIVTARILGCFWGSIILAPILYSYSAWNFFLIVPLLGWAAYKIQFILHDCSHKTLFRTNRLNEVIGTVSGLFIGVYFLMYRYTHMQHHRINGEPDDPQYPDYLGGEHLTGREYLLFIISPIVGSRLVSYLAREFGPTLFRRSASNNSASNLVRQGPAITPLWAIELIMMQLLIATVVTNFWSFPLLMFALPIAEGTVSLFLSRVRTLAEHQKTQTEAAHDFSRTHLPTIIDQILLYDANFNYHVEHHLEPAIPSRNLPELYKTHTKQIHTEETLRSRMIETLFHIYKADPS